MKQWKIVTIYLQQNLFITSCPSLGDQQVFLSDERLHDVTTVQVTNAISGSLPVLTLKNVNQGKGKRKRKNYNAMGNRAGAGMYIHTVLFTAYLKEEGSCLGSTNSDPLFKVKTSDKVNRGKNGRTEAHSGHPEIFGPSYLSKLSTKNICNLECMSKPIY
uniref:Uncharacterized protein n=1 Tax=Glossina austeni TaxID=7395 RepID=A0A1A9VV28_GLOAU